jgi:hypothetical protein
MPLATDLRKRSRIVLTSDQDLPEDERPTFVYRRLTGSESLDLADLVDGINADQPPRESLEIAYKAIMIGLVGLENITDLAGKKLKLGDEIAWQNILTISEVMEIAHRLFAEQELSVEDKKKLDSPSDSDTVKSARRVRGKINAPTSRTKQKQ